MATALLGGVGVVVVGLLVFIGARLPSLESQRSDFQAIVGPLQTDIGRLQARVDTLEVAREQDARRFKVSVRYIRALLDFIRVHAPEQLVPPPIPIELTDEV